MLEWSFNKNERWCSSTLNIHDCDTVTKHKYKIVDRFAKLSEDGNKSFTGGYITGGIDNKGGPDDNEGGGAIFSQGVCSLNGGTLIANRAADKGIQKKNYFRQKKYKRVK